MDRKITLTFGAMADRLDEQLERQGLIADLKQLEYFQRDYDALVRCKVRGLVGESVVTKAAGRLLDRIAREIKEAK